MLINFLYERDKPYDGILQKFIEPDTPNNFVLRINWSPKLCVFEKSVNNHPVHKRDIDVYERACTFEGPANYATSHKVRSEYITHQLITQANSIAYHIQNITFELKVIDRMVLNFKVDKQGRMWFLWCSSLRVKGSEIEEMPKIQDKLNEEVFPEQIMNSKRPGMKHLIKAQALKNEQQREYHQRQL